MNLIEDASEMFCGRDLGFCGTIFEKVFSRLELKKYRDAKYTS